MSPCTTSSRASGTAPRRPARAGRRWSRRAGRTSGRATGPRPRPGGRPHGHDHPADDHAPHYPDHLVDVHHDDDDDDDDHPAHHHDHHGPDDHDHHGPDDHDHHGPDDHDHHGPDDHDDQPPTTTTTTQPTTTSTTSTPTTTTTTTPPLPPDPTPEGSFGLAWLPDTQDETSGGPYYDRFEQRTRWLADNSDDLGLKFVGSSGDVTNWGWLVPAQFQVASTAMRTIEEAGIPYAMTVGNHDTRAVGWNGVQGSTGYGGSAYMYNPECLTRFSATECQSPKLVRHTEEFNGTFTASRYTSVGGAYEPGKVDNIFSTFSAGGHRWLVLTLELWARPDVVSWARTVVEEHPQHNVIIQTHHYLNGDGSIGGDNGGYGSTSPQYLWNNLVSQYPNIKMVFSGHVGAAANRTDTGVNGNTVYSFLTCMHDKSSNPVRLLNIDPAAGTISTRIYSPWTNTSFPDYAKTYTGVKFVG